jgi:hypothetical protein
VGDIFEPLNKKHLFDAEFNVGRVLVGFHVSRTWTWENLSPDNTEKTTHLIALNLIRKKMNAGADGLCVNLIFVPFCIYIGWVH